MIKDFKVGVHVHKGSTIVLTQKTPQKELEYWADKHPELLNSILFSDEDNSNTDSADVEAKPKQVKSKPKRQRKSSSK